MSDVRDVNSLSPGDEVLLCASYGDGVSFEGPAVYRCHDDGAVLVEVPARGELTSLVVPWGSDEIWIADRSSGAAFALTDDEVIGGEPPDLE